MIPHDVFTFGNMSGGVCYQLTTCDWTIYFAMGLGIGYTIATAIYAYLAWREERDGPDKDA